MREEKGLGLFWQQSELLDNRWGSCLFLQKEKAPFQIFYYRLSNILLSSLSFSFTLSLPLSQSFSLPSISRVMRAT